MAAFIQVCLTGPLDYDSWFLTLIQFLRQPHAYPRLRSASMAEYAIGAAGLGVGVASLSIQLFEGAIEGIVLSLHGTLSYD